MSVYNLFKFVHVAAVIVWVGGMVTIGVVNARVAREHNASAMASLTRASEFLGRAVVGPAAGLTLVAGIVMVVVGELSFATLWIVWGMAGLVVSGILGSTLIRRAGEELGEAVGAEPVDEGRSVALRERLRTLNILNVLVLFSVVWAMVFKPTL